VHRLFASKLPGRQSNSRQAGPDGDSATHITIRCSKGAAWVALMLIVRRTNAAAFPQQFAAEIADSRLQFPSRLKNINNFSHLPRWGRMPVGPFMLRHAATNGAA
jgi:hypothetical protein